MIKIIIIDIIIPYKFNKTLFFSKCKIIQSLCIISPDHISLMGFFFAFYIRFQLSLNCLSNRHSIWKRFVKWHRKNLLPSFACLFYHTATGSAIKWDGPTNNLPEVVVINVDLKIVLRIDGNFFRNGVLSYSSRKTHTSHILQFTTTFIS